MARVLVVGSVNRDVVLRVPHLPAQGETVMGRGVALGLGGKGANQAAAAARAGAVVSFLGSVGDDLHGPALRRELGSFGVDVHLLADVEGPSGQAFVRVDDDGQNSIVVVAGANAATGPDHVDAARDHLAAVDVVVVQGEVPVATVERTIRLAVEVGTTCLVNLAPYVVLPTDLLGIVDVLVVNQNEAGQVLDAPPPDGDVAAARAAAALAGIARAVVVSRGARGATVAVGPDTEPSHVPAPPVGRVVDTTGAGDALVGVLAAALARGHALLPAAFAAVAAASRTVTSSGAAASYPTFTLDAAEGREPA